MLHDEATTKRPRSHCVLRFRPLRSLIVIAGCAICWGCAPRDSQPSAPAAKSDSDASDVAASAAAPPTNPQPPADSTEQPNAKKTASVAVGGDPAASLEQLTNSLRALLEAHDQVDKLFFPGGYNRQRFHVLEATSDLVAPEGASNAPRGVIHLTVEHRMSRVHKTREGAVQDDDLHPRRSTPPEDFLSDLRNPVLKPVPLTLRYEARDGLWVRTDWEGHNKLGMGKVWLDQIGAP